MTRDELEDFVPVHDMSGKPAFIRLVDVPNPFRTECYYDHTCANVPGQWCIWVWDWRRWLSVRFSGSYQPRFRASVPVITDDMIASEKE